MFLTPYFSSSNHQFQFTRQQASHFAKKVAGDFNPIHDEDNKRFCVPGDLLFAVLLKKEGISQKMSFNFSGMVNDGIALHIERKDEVESAVVIDENGKEYLHMTREGQINHDTAFIEHLVTSYVRFSGMNFPHILIPLLEEKQVMINCERPLVIYESMQIEFDHLNLTHPEIEFQNATLDVEGKRGFVTLNFSFKDAGQIVGQGIKRMVASGLKDYHQVEVDDLVQRFNDRKARFMTQFATEAACA